MMLNKCSTYRASRHATQAVAPQPHLKSIGLASATTALAVALMVQQPAWAGLNKYEYAAGQEFDNG